MKRFYMKQKGMTLLEVVVAMLVIAIALATTISMLQVSNLYGNSAEYRATATREMRSIINQIHTNKLGIDGYLTANKDRIIDAGNGSDKDAKKTAYTLAHAQIKAWTDNIKNVLPDGEATIEKINANSNGGSNEYYKVKVSWTVNAENKLTDNSNNTRGNNNKDSLEVFFTP